MLDFDPVGTYAQGNRGEGLSLWLRHCPNLVTNGPLEPVSHFDRNARYGRRNGDELLGSIFAAAAPYTGEGEACSAGVLAGTDLG